MSLTDYPNLQVTIPKIPIKKYVLENISETVLTFSYQGTDLIWVYQEELYPNQTKTIWTVENTFTIPNYFLSNLNIKSEDYLVSNGSETISVENGFPSFRIFFSSLASITPNIKVEYLFIDLNLSWCDQVGNWNLLTTSTPPSCPTYADFGVITGDKCNPYIILRATDTLTNKPVKFYFGSRNTYGIQFPDPIDNPCLPNSTPWQVPLISNCGGVTWQFTNNDDCLALEAIGWFSIIPEPYSDCPPPDFALVPTCSQSSLVITAYAISSDSVPAQFSTSYFISEASALANTNWRNPIFCEPQNGIQWNVDPPMSGTFWVSMKDGIGRIVAKSVNVDCIFPTPTNTPTVTKTPTNTPTVTKTPTNTPSPTPTNTITVTPTNTNTPSKTPTSTPTVTSTSTNTPTTTSTPTNTPSNTPEPTPTPTPNWSYINVTQYLDCIQNSSPGAYQMRIPSTMSGTWFYTGDGYQYQFDSNQMPPYSWTLEAGSSSSGCVS